MVAWRVAYSLDKLLAQLNGLAPFRSKVSDGAIGDAAHATRDSDHNPWFVLGGQHLVTARDFTHDPANGLDCHWLAETLASGRDSRIKYVIWDRHIIDSRAGQHPWTWMPYTGISPHAEHLHLSVMDNASADDTRAWTLTPYLPLDDDIDMTPAEVAEAVWKYQTTNVVDRNAGAPGAWAQDRLSYVDQRSFDIVKKLDELITLIKNGK